MHYRFTRYLISGTAILVCLGLIGLQDFSYGEHIANTRVEAGDVDWEMEAEAIIGELEPVDDRPPSFEEMRTQAYWVRREKGLPSLEEFWGLPVPEYPLYIQSGIPPLTETTLHCLKQAAERGNPFIQVMLGRMFLNGGGIPRDSQQSLYWFQKAADWGSIDAQEFIGAMYFRGMGIPKDYAAAYMWFSLAASNETESRKSFLKSLLSLLEKKMTPSQIEEGQRLARDWKPKKTN